MAVAYVYKIVKCKSCGSQVDIEYLGPAVNMRIAGVIRNPGHVRCQHCGASHEYTENDIRFNAKDHPPIKR